MSVAPSFTAACATLPRLARINLLLLAAAVAGLCIRLWPEWRHNPDLSHGMFMPLVFLVLLHESRHGSQRYLRRSRPLRAGFALLLIGAVVALLAAGLYAAAVDWSHPLVNASQTLSLGLLLTAALIIYADDGVRLIPWNWSAFVAIALWLFCTPLPPGTYSRLTVALQLWISQNVLRSLHVLGIAAVRHGNIIDLAHATVGVEEACSGIRSLISCVFAGLFFSATLVRRAWGRALIIGLAAPLALGMNFVRSLTLTLLANAGVDISGTWHDFTGFAVLGITAVILGGLAFMLERRPTVPAPVPPVSPGVAPRSRLVALTSVLGLMGLLVVGFIANTRPPLRESAPAPDLLGLLPESPGGWQVKTTNDLYQFRNTLQTDHLAQRIYQKPAADGGFVEITIYLAYWHAGQAPVSLVASHTPDACWPGSGWMPLTAPSEPEALKTSGRTLPRPEYRLFKLGDFPQHVWFWHLYDGRPLIFHDPYSAVELLRLAWRYGFRHDGDQMFVRISSNRPWPELAHEPLLADFFRRIQPLGL
jgi:exosortase